MQSDNVNPSHIMLTDITKLTLLLPTSAQLFTQSVAEAMRCIHPRLSEGTIAHAALAAGIREAVETCQVNPLLFAGMRQPSEFVRLLGFADAFCRREIAVRLNIHPVLVATIARGIGNNRISHSRRINGIFRAAIQFAETV